MKTPFKRLATENKKVMSLAFAAIMAGTSILTSCQKEEIENLAPQEQTQEKVEAIGPMVAATADTTGISTLATTAVDLRVDLGSTTPPAKYNKASVGVSSPVALKDYATGATTSIKLATTAPFKSSYTNSQTYPSTLGIPQSSAADLFYGSGQTAILELSGLDKSIAYDFTFFSSRMNASGSLETQFKVVGYSSKTVVLEAVNNTSKTIAVTGIKPNAEGKIRIETNKGPKNTNSAGNFWFNYMQVTAAASTTTPPPTTTEPAPLPPTTEPAPLPPTTPPTTPPTANYTVSNYTDLVAALSKASSGQVVYITDNVEINVTGKPALVVKGGVTIASGRGINGSKGARIYTTQIASNPVIQISGAGAKVSGLRIDGPTTTESNSSSTYHRGILSNQNNTTVEYCELSGFNHTTVLLSKGAHNALIRYNYIHHNPASGLGYGVVFADESNGLVTHNIFDRNRHAIATGGYVSSGYKLNGYEASFNTVFRGNTQGVHDFDAHGANDQKTVAGTLYNVHDNTFYNTKASFSFQMRGYPQDHANFVNNKTVLKALTSPSGTSVAVGFTPGDVNRQTPPEQYFTISGNQTGIAVPAGIPTDLNAKLPDALAPLPSR